MDRLLDLPFGAAVTLLFLVVFLRANATYWLGRGVGAGARRSRVHARLEGAPMQRAERFMASWGVLAVPLSFLTVGLQTAVNASAGLTRMPLRRYLPSVAVGCVAWAVLYATVGLGAVAGLAALAARSPWALAAVLVLALAGGAAWWFRPARRPQAVTVWVEAEPKLTTHA